MDGHTLRWPPTSVVLDTARAATTPILDRQYRLVRELGRGSMGIVYLAEDLRLRRHVAIKVLEPAAAADPDANDRFDREAVALAALKHPNIMPIFGMSADPVGRRYLVMEYLRGETVDTVCSRAAAKGERVPVRTAIAWILGVAQGLGAAHEAGIVHRDVSGGNVIITSPDGRPVLTDFGLVRVAASSGTSLGIAGTPRYLAPELLSGDPVPAAQAHLADIYALGILAFELLTGRAPFESDDLFELMRLHREETPPPPSMYRPELPAMLDRAVLWALEKDAFSRPPSCAAFSTELGACQDVTVRARPVPLPRRATILLATPSTELVQRFTLAVAGDERRIKHVRDGEAAWAYAAQYRIDMVVLSLDLAGLNAVELIAALRGAPKTAAVPTAVVAPSSTLSPADRALLDHLGVRLFVRPDADDDQLRTLVRRMASPGRRGAC